MSAFICSIHSHTYREICFYCNQPMVEIKKEHLLPLAMQKIKQGNVYKMKSNGKKFFGILGAFFLEVALLYFCRCLFACKRSNLSKNGRKI